MIVPKDLAELFVKILMTIVHVKMVAHVTMMIMTEQHSKVVHVHQNGQELSVKHLVHVKMVANV